MKIRYILNPNSGRNRRRPWLGGCIERFLMRNKLDADLRVTEAPAHATALAREAVEQGADRVVAVGGDGTLNEVAQALVHTRTILGLIPCGSGNGLALHLGLPLNFERALLLSGGNAGYAHVMDSGEANGHPFFNVMGLGLDAEVSRRFNLLTKRGLPAYARTAWGVLREHRAERVRFSSNACAATRQEEEICLLSIANSDQYGNHARIAPGASVSDGVLDLVAVRAVGWLEVPALSMRLFAGTLNESAHIKRLRGASFVVERQAPGLIHTDGEPRETGSRIEVRVHPGSLKIWRGTQA